MAAWNLSRLRWAIRKITGKLDPSQIGDTTGGSVISPSSQPGIDDFINDFYLLDLDEHLRLLPLRTYYTFSTVENVGTYALPTNFSNTFPNLPIYFSAEPPIYCDGYQMGWYQEPDPFYAFWPELKTVNVGIAVGNGGQAYNFTVTQTPIQQGTVTIGTQGSSSPAVAQESFTDSGASDFFANPGVLTGNLGGTGTIDYLTGAVSLTYQVAVAQGVNINAHYYAYVAARPTSCLFYHQTFTLKPIPNDVYEIKVVAYQQPTVVLGGGGSSGQFANSLDSALYNEWWQMIAYGAALKIFIEDGDHAEYQYYKGYFEEAKMLAQRRTLRQLARERIPGFIPGNGGVGSSWPMYPTTY